MRILVTSIGAPGSDGTIFSLNAYEIITCDCDPEVWHGAHPFIKVPHAGALPKGSDAYLKAVSVIDADVIIPQSEDETIVMAYHDTLRKKCPINGYSKIQELSDKYNFLKLVEKVTATKQEYLLIRTAEDLAEALELFGSMFVIKPLIGSGGRGFRVVAAEKSYDPTSKLDSTISIETIGDLSEPVIATPYLPGREWTVDCLAKDGELIYNIPRLRLMVKQGVSWQGEIQRNGHIEEIVEAITEHLKLDYFFGFQFKEDTAGNPVPTECNLRIQGTMGASTLAGANIIEGGVKLLVGEEVIPQKVNWGLRFYRHTVISA